MVLNRTKATYRILLVIGIAFLVAAPFYIGDFFFPSIELAALPYLLFGLFALVEGLSALVLWRRLAKVDPNKLCAGIARYEFIVTPVFALSTLFLSMILPRDQHTWLYYSNATLTTVLFVFRSGVSIYFSHRLKKGEEGIIGLRNHSWIAASFLLVMFNFYVLSAIKVQGIDLAALAKGDLSALTDLYSWLTLAEILVGMFILFQSLFMTIATHFSAKEDCAFDFRTNFKVSLIMYDKYEVGYWISIFATGILLVLSIVSAVRLFDAYFALVVLYGAILVVRITAYFRRRYIVRKYGEEPMRAFMSEHRILIYAAVMLLVYTIVSIFFGNQTFSQVRLQAQDRAELITLGVFVPWAILKIILTAFTARTAIVSGHPKHLMDAYINVLIAIFTLAKAIFIIAGYTQFEWVRITGIVVGVIMYIYCFAASVRLLILGIRGLMGKRKEAYERYIAEYTFLPQMSWGQDDQDIQVTGVQISDKKEDEEPK